MDRIRAIVEKRYRNLAISMLGREAFSKEELKEMEKAGIDTSNKTSLLELAYYHNYLNPHGTTAPISIEDMQTQQRQPQTKPAGKAHDYAVQHANEAVKSAIDKIKGDAISRLIGFIQQNNEKYKFNALQNITREEAADKLVKESTLFKLKQILRDTSKDANRDWLRVAITEVSNVIGAGSVDRVVSENRDKSPTEVYVYRIVVNDAALCKYCRKFYLDGDGAPKVYRLSTLLSNGSNYGKKAADWLPVVGATHPNERCSQVIEIKPGWKVLPGGKQVFIGREAWNEYIVNKVTA